VSNFFGRRGDVRWFRKKSPLPRSYWGSPKEGARPGVDDRGQAVILHGGLIWKQILTDAARDLVGADEITNCKSKLRDERACPTRPGDMTPPMQSRFVSPLWNGWREDHE
jgi:hypothetical protein